MTAKPKPAKKRTVRCKCGHGIEKHHLPVRLDPRPGMHADTYCECGSEDCWPGYDAPWQHMDEIRATVARGAA